MLLENIDEIRGRKINKKARM